MLQHFTIDNWTVVLYNLKQANESSWSICVFMVIFGNFFLMNLILAVIIQSFDDIIQRGDDELKLQYLFEDDEEDLQLYESKKALEQSRASQRSAKNASNKSGANAS